MFSHKETIELLTSAAIEARAMSESGDGAHERAGRHMLIVSSVLLNIVSAMPEKEYDKFVEKLDKDLDNVEETKEA